MAPNTCACRTKGGMRIGRAQVRGRVGHTTRRAMSEHQRLWMCASSRAATVRGGPREYSYRMRSRNDSRGRGDARIPHEVTYIHT
eukprot:6212686-Pleurochrysis_carterae.AAC.6